MHLNSAQIQKQSSVIWILVANGKHAQIYHYHKNQAVMPMHEPQWHSANQDKEHHELTLVPGMTLTAESPGDFDVSHDGSGSLVGGQNAGHNSCEPHLDIHDEIKQNLVMTIVAKLKQARQNGDFDRLVIAASPKILGLLRRHLPIEVVAHVLTEIPKDFTHDQNAALLAHLQETLAKACIA